MKTNNSDYYDFHWKIFSSIDYSQSKLDKAEVFFSPIENHLRNNIRILDIGCGDGVHWYYLRQIKNINIDYTGIDISSNCIDILRKKSQFNNDNFLTMDATSLSFPNNIFDIVFAYGSIGYTSNAFMTLSEMKRVCKQGGLIGIFSAEITKLSKSILLLLRHLTKKMSNNGKNFIANLIVPFFGFLPSDSQVSLKNSNWQQVKEVILTDIAPPYLRLISNKEFLHWFEILKISILFENLSNKSFIWGIKKA